MVMMHTTLLFAILLGCSLMHPAAALIHVVGGMDGWGVPPNASFYAEWAEPRTFGIGDELVFPYRVGAHNVIQVAKADYDDCGHDHVVNQYYQGPTVLKLNTLGDYYFYSGIGTHCELGQKLHIKVVAGPGSSGQNYDESLDFDFGPAAAPSPTGLHIHSEDTHSAASTNAAQLLAVVSCIVLAVLFV